MKRYMRRCPFCKGRARIVVCDDEGNVHNEEYEDDPWSGLAYRLSHTEADDPTGACPITSDDFVGDWYYDTRNEAVRAWNGHIAKKMK